MSKWELDDVDQWLKTKLVALAGTEDVFNSLRAGRGKKLFVCFRYVPRAGDVFGQGAGNRILSRPSFDIEVVTEGPPTDVSESMVKAIETGLSGITDTAGEFHVVGRRLDAISRETPGVGEQYFVHRGGSYQFWLS